MKYMAYFVIITFLVIIILPTAIVKGCTVIYKPEEKIDTDKLMIRVYNHTEDKVVEMELEEYIKGVVAAEMPAAFEREALKAQAVAARTYTVARIRSLGGSGCSQHIGADICTDPAHCQAWHSKSALLRRWKFFNYYIYWGKISSAVDETEGLIVTYNGKIVDPVFHSTSGGKTENSEDVWENPVPYLRSVVSKYEERSPRFVETKGIPIQTFIGTLNNTYPDARITERMIREEMCVLERSEGGRIKHLQIGNKVFKGTEIRKLFGLNSTNFNWKFNGNNLDITTTGYGHGVGMSQYGADGMARNGSNFEEILKHYYTGVQIVKFSHNEQSDILAKNKN